LGHAVACANVAPVQLHGLIYQAGIYTWQIIAALEGDGGESYYNIGICAQLRVLWGRQLVLESILKVQEREPIFFRGLQDHNSSCGQQQGITLLN